ncbi:hypothetical protein [Streptomyces sp. NPDC002054]|uniref:hypothetical protein n=1 Tax=Streptomyces sp. NPDC002054 TaxID=3154663 RepID=UPI0033305B00
MSALSPPGRPAFDPAERIPSLAALRASVQRQAWDEVAAAFAALTDEDDRALACRVVSQTPGAEPFLRRTATEHPGDPLPRTLLAELHIQTGWQLRSDHGAEHVSRRQFADFHARLRRAEQLLIDLCAGHPDHALPWYLRLMTARGLELGQNEARRRYDRLTEHHPHHFSGQMQLLQQLCPKWGGSWEAAHGFAEEAAAGAPEGSPNGALIAIVQMEQYLALSEGRKRDGEAYLRESAHRDRLIEAAHRSVLHPDFRTDCHQAVAAHSAFAAAHSAAGRHLDAAPHFRALGDAADEFLWGYIGSYDHEAEFVRHRKLALAKG